MKRFALALTVFGLAACGAGEPKITSFTLNPSTIAKGGSTTVTIVVENFTMISDHDGAQALRPSHEGVADNDSGHLHIYLDDTMTNPLVMTASTTFTVKTSSTIAAGDHKLIAQLRRIDHLLVSPEVKAEAALKIQ
jgi:hypothetical protein